MNKNNKVDELLVAAKTSHNRAVKEALNKLLFTVSLTHNKEYIEKANSYHFHSGCTLTVPRSVNDTTMTIVWNDEEVGVHSMGHCFVQFRYGNIIEQHDPVPGVILTEDRNYTR